MSTVVIVTLAITVWVVSKLYKIGKRLSDAEAAAPASAPQPTTVHTFEEEEQSAGYFTHETATEEIVETKGKKSKKARRNRQEKPVEMSAPKVQEESLNAVVKNEAVQQEFDLRQAIIYQTILHNKYIPEIQ